MCSILFPDINRALVLKQNEQTNQPTMEKLVPNRYLPQPWCHVHQVWHHSLSDDFCFSQAISLPQDSRGSDTWFPEGTFPDWISMKPMGEPKKGQCFLKYGILWKNNMNIVVTFWKHIKKHVCELLIIKKTSWTRGIKRTIWSAFLLVSDVGNWSGWIKATWTAKVSFCGWILMVYKTMGVHKGTSFQQVIGENSWKPRRSNVFWWMIAAKGKKTTTPQKHPKKENNMGKHGKITRGNHMGSWFLAMLI